MTDTATQTAWRLEWRDRIWSSTDLTGDHVAAISEMVGVAPSWEWTDPRLFSPAFGPLQTMALIAAFIVVEDGVVGAKARTAVLDVVREATVDELVAAIVLND